MMETPREWSAKLPLFIGLFAVVSMLGGLGVWSVGTKISGAVLAQGKVQLESDRQIIQHPDGGVVGAILKRDGDSVVAGDVLLRLDGTFLTSELAVVEGQLAEIFVRRARLIAERDDAPNIDFTDAPIFNTSGRAFVAGLAKGQRNLFEARRVSRRQESRQLGEQSRQIESQITGTRAQLSAFNQQLELIESELVNVRILFTRGLVQATRVHELRREGARLMGEIGSLNARIAEARARKSGIAIEQLKLKNRLREDAITQLRDIGYSQIELEETRIRLRERISRLEVRAPIAGVVFDSRVSAIQSVLRPAETMMFLVPGNHAKLVIARIDPLDIEQVFPGQEVALKFTTFTRRTTPDIPARVMRISPDADADEASGEQFYEAVLEPDYEVLAALPDLRLLPGMPVEVFLKTEERTPLSYLTHPLTVYFQRAFRER